MAESRVINQAMETPMTTANTSFPAPAHPVTLTPVHRSPRIAATVRSLATSATTWWGLYRTRRILSGLDERTLKDIGAPALDRAASSADPRVLRHLDSLR
jgi:uncharacterized protein YjiS (DUF1127 family)